MLFANRDALKVFETLFDSQKVLHDFELKSNSLLLFIKTDGQLNDHLSHPKYLKPVGIAGI